MLMLGSSFRVFRGEETFSFVDFILLGICAGEKKKSGKENNKICQKNVCIRGREKALIELLATFHLVSLNENEGRKLISL
jgi:hypothetical protein